MALPSRGISKGVRPSTSEKAQVSALEASDREANLGIDCEYGCSQMDRSVWVAAQRRH